MNDLCFLSVCVPSHCRYSIERVFRPRKLDRAHPRELLECAFDIITPVTNSLLPDAETIYTISEIVQEFPALQVTTTCESVCVSDDAASRRAGPVPLLLLRLRAVRSRLAASLFVDFPPSRAFIATCCFFSCFLFFPLTFLTCLSMSVTDGFTIYLFSHGNYVVCCSLHFLPLCLTLFHFLSTFPLGMSHEPCRPRTVQWFPTLLCRAPLE